MKLALKARHIVLCHNLRMNMVFDRIILRGKSERVPPHGIEHVVALHSSLSRHNVKRRVRTRMSHMKPLPRGVRELHQRIIFRFGVILRCLESLLVVPDLLPLCLHFSVIVHFCHVTAHTFPAAYGFFIANLRQEMPCPPQFFQVYSYSTYFIILTGFVNCFLAISPDIMR